MNPDGQTFFTAQQHYLGFLRTRITESPRKKSLLMKRSLLTGLAFFLPPCGISVHISLTFSRTILQCRSNAFTRPKIFLLFLQFTKTWELSLTHFWSTESGPTSKLSSRSPAPYCNADRK